MKIFKWDLPSLFAVFQTTLNVWKRFPFVVLCSITGTASALAQINYSGDFQKDSLDFEHLIMVSVLGLTWFLSVDLFCESKGISRLKKLFIDLILVVLLIVYYSTMAHRMSDFEMIKFFILCLTGHLFVSFAPFIGKFDPDGFWSYNKHLFIRILTAFIYSGVLFAGLALALLAIDNLFAFHIPDEYYMRLWVCMAGIFNTWFYLGGVPREFDKLKDDHQYPIGLKFFTQYVLIPLISFYLLILYAYIGKILVTATWPQGWVSWLVLCFSVAGILALLLVWPVRNQEGNRWIRMYANGFFLALFPLIILLFCAITIRVGDYGITANRYYVVLLACWLTGIACYFLLSKLKSIKVVPMSLFMVGILSVFGPWSAINVAEKSQLSRMKELMEEAHMLVDGKAVPYSGKDTSDEKSIVELISKIDYMVDEHGYKSMQPLFKQDLDSLMSADSSKSNTAYYYSILKLLNISESVSDVSASRNSYFYYSVDNASTYKITGYDYRIEVNLYNPRNNEESQIREFKLDSNEVKLVWQKNNGILLINSGSDVVKFNIMDLLVKLHKLNYPKPGEVPINDLTLENQAGSTHAKILIRIISGNETYPVNDITDLTVEVFLRLK